MPHRGTGRVRKRKEGNRVEMIREGRGGLQGVVGSREAEVPEFERLPQQKHAILRGEHLNGLSAPDVQHEAVAFHSCHNHKESDVGPDCSLLDSASIVETDFYPCPSALSSPYHSSRIERLKKSRSEFGGTDLDFDIEASKSTWTEGTLQEDDHELVREENIKAFEELWRHPKFKPYELDINEGNLVGVGGEAEIYAADGTLWERRSFFPCSHCIFLYFGRSRREWPDCSRCWDLSERRDKALYPLLAEKIVERKQLVVKVFKDGFLLSALLKKWSPRWIMAEASSERSNTSGGSLNLCWAVGAQLLNVGKFRGRFALLLPRFECDLRKLIDRRKVRGRADGPPFERDHALFIVHELAKAMAALHELGLLHRDLKAANILCNCKDGLVDELSVADFETSVDVIGTLFWRAPEIFKAMKTRFWFPHPVTRESDVYSFGMTCYEVVTGLIPFEDSPANKYDEVIEGKRPKLPDDFCPELNSLIRRCWQDNPLRRPSFQEIVALVEYMRQTHSKGSRPKGRRFKKKLLLRYI